MPHEHTIRTWYSKSDVHGEPGFQTSTVERLRKIANEYKCAKNEKMVCCLAFDEMYIRKQIYWSLQQMEYVGFTTKIDDNSSDAACEDKREKRVAKQAIVFILNGVNTRFEFPLAYFFIDSLDAEQRKKLLLEATKIVTECGIRISNVTFDGLASNFSMCEKLGANLDVLSTSFQPYFHNPINGEKIYTILDPCHMEKLVRNILAGKGVIYHNNGNKIEWKYVDVLYEISKKYDLRTHKLNKKHIQWRRHIMNVRIAAQTFSNSVASSMKFLMQSNEPSFIAAAETIKFFEIMNRLFDIFNTKDAKKKDLFKQPINANNKRIIFDFMESTIRYFQELMIDEKVFRKNKDGTPLQVTRKVQLLKSRSKTGFRGFIVNMQALMLMYKQFVESEGILKQIPTYYIQQDVVELFFQKVRISGRCNNNPNMDQFKGAYRRLQANIKVELGNGGNCRVFEDALPENIFYSNVYFVSSKRALIPHNSHAFEQAYENHKDEILNLSKILEDRQAIDQLLDGTTNFTVYFGASRIEKKILDCKNFHCNDCKLVLIENEKHELFGSILDWKPCSSTFRICKNAERLLKVYASQYTKSCFGESVEDDIGFVDAEKSNNPTNTFKFNVIYCLIFRSLDLESLFPNSKFECDPNHKYQFIKCIVGEFIAMWATHLSNYVTLEQHDQLLRQGLNRTILFKGQ